MNVCVVGVFGSLCWRLATDGEYRLLSFCPMKVRRVLLVMASGLFLSWTPLYVTILVIAVHHDVGPQHPLLSVTHLMFYSSVIVLPLAHLAFNTKFRQALQEVFYNGSSNASLQVRVITVQSKEEKGKERRRAPAAGCQSRFRAFCKFFIPSSQSAEIQLPSPSSTDHGSFRDTPLPPLSPTTGRRLNPIQEVSFDRSLCSSSVDGFQRSASVEADGTATADSSRMSSRMSSGLWWLESPVDESWTSCSESGPCRSQSVPSSPSVIGVKFMSQQTVQNQEDSYP